MKWVHVSQAFRTTWTKLARWDCSLWSHMFWEHSTCWPVNSRGLNCMVPRVCRLFFDKCSTVLKMHFLFCVIFLITFFFFWLYHETTAYNTYNLPSMCELTVYVISKVSSQQEVLKFWGSQKLFMNFRPPCCLWIHIKWIQFFSIPPRCFIT